MKTQPYDNYTDFHEETRQLLQSLCSRKSAASSMIKGEWQVMEVNCSL